MAARNSRRHKGTEHKDACCDTFLCSFAPAACIHQCLFHFVCCRWSQLWTRSLHHSRQHLGATWTRMRVPKRLESGKQLLLTTIKDVGDILDSINSLIEHPKLTCFVHPTCQVVLTRSSSSANGLRLGAVDTCMSAQTAVNKRIRV